MGAKRSRNTVALVRTSDRRRWQEACVASYQPATAFHDHAWLMLAGGMTGTSFVPFVVTHDGKDIGVAPLMVRRRGPLSMVNWMPFPYVGPLVPPEHLATTLDALDRWALRLATVRQQQSFPPHAVVDDAALIRHRFVLHEDHTYIVPVHASQEQQWEALAGRCRTSLRKAQSLGVRIEEAQSGETLGAVVSAAFAARGLQSGYRAAFPPGPDRLKGLGLPVRYTIAILDGRPVGSLAAVEQHGRVLLWQAGVLPQFRGSQANVLLYWDLIGWARDLGARSVDLVGLPDEGIAHFKQQFGGKLTSYTVARRTSPLLRTLQAARIRVNARP
jgi:hypothetical protein